MLRLREFSQLSVARMCWYPTHYCHRRMGLVGISANTIKKHNLSWAFLHSSCCYICLYQESHKLFLATECWWDSWASQAWSLKIDQSLGPGDESLTKQQGYSQRSRGLRGTVPQLWVNLQYVLSQNPPLVFHLLVVKFLNAQAFKVAELNQDTCQQLSVHCRQSDVFIMPVSEEKPTSLGF